jgi:hypothetical protein
MTTTDRRRPGLARLRDDSERTDALQRKPRYRRKAVAGEHCHHAHQCRFAVGRFSAKPTRYVGRAPSAHPGSCCALAVPYTVLARGPTDASSDDVSCSSVAYSFITHSGHGCSTDVHPGRTTHLVCQSHPVVVSLRSTAGLDCVHCPARRHALFPLAALWGEYRCYPAG